MSSRNGSWRWPPPFSRCCRRWRWWCSCSACSCAALSRRRNSAMANVTLTDVRKTYAGGFEAIKGISLEVGDGQFCVLDGPSGCRKSTLLRMIAGLETTTWGAIEIGGRVVNEIGPAERDNAMVFQNYALYPHMSVYNNMAYGLRNRRMPEVEIDTR